MRKLLTVLYGAPAIARSCIEASSNVRRNRRCGPEYMGGTIARRSNRVARSAHPGEREAVSALVLSPRLTEEKRYTPHSHVSSMSLNRYWTASQFAGVLCQETGR